MNENNVANQGKKKFEITVKNVMRLLSVLCVVFVFCPSFMVSCAGKEINVSAMTAVKGVSAYGEQVVEPHPVMLICLLLPIAVLVFLFVKKFSEKKTAGIIMVCSAADFVIWFIFRATVKKIAEENYCSFKTTGWYVINLIALLLLILFSLLVVLKKIAMEKDLLSQFAAGGSREILSQMSDTVSQMSNAVGSLAGSVADNMNQKKPKEDVIGYCSKCGSPIAYDCKFCISCGTPVPESMIAEAEAKRKAEEEAARQEAEAKRKAEEEEARQEAARQEVARQEVARQEAEAKQKAEEEAAGNVKRFCRNCGAKVASDAFFCESCGTKVR